MCKIYANGNTKLGNMGSFSKLYGNKTYWINDLNMAVKGTCGNYCAGCEKECYVRKSYRHGSVMLNHARNTVSMRENTKQSFKDMDLQMSRKRKPFEIVRIHQSGEFEKAEEVDGWSDLARKHPETKFYVYTKAYDLVVPKLLDGTIPSNLTVLISIWHSYGMSEYEMVKSLPNVKAFVVDDGYDYGLEFDTRCMAYDSKGKLNHNITCDKCKKCFNRGKKSKVIACYEH